jgi:hypothetical protein
LYTVTQQPLAGHGARIARPAERDERPWKADAAGCAALLLIRHHQYAEDFPDEGAAPGAVQRIIISQRLLRMISTNFDAKVQRRIGPISSDASDFNSGFGSVV